MTEKERIAGLAEQIELAKKQMSEWPEWLRSTAHFAGSNHSSEATAPNADQADGQGETVKLG